MAENLSIVRTVKKASLKAEIILGLAAARALITLVPFRWWRKTLGPIGRSADAPAADLTPKQIKQAGDIGRIIKRLARKQKFEAVCFPQAITGRWVLGRRGIPSQVILGSRKDDTPEGVALHAWLKVGDQVVTGQDEYEEFQAFSTR